ncbi:MAG: TetR family transcriptional regulator [Spirochaetes bacterium]|nr:TetR family transcriptional regulator [Spirochaetota bacterium]
MGVDGRNPRGRSGVRRDEESVFSDVANRRIAEAAGVNEVTLFRPFGNTQQLLMAAAARRRARIDPAEHVRRFLEGRRL